MLLVMLFLWVMLLFAIYVPGWFVLGLAGGQACTDAAPWIPRAQAIWGIISAVLAALAAAII